MNLPEENRRKFEGGKSPNTESLRYNKPPLHSTGHPCSFTEPGVKCQLTHYANHASVACGRVVAHNLRG